MAAGPRSVGRLGGFGELREFGDEPDEIAGIQLDVVALLEAAEEFVGIPAKAENLEIFHPEPRLRAAVADDGQVGRLLAHPLGEDATPAIPHGKDGGAFGDEEIEPRIRLVPGVFGGLDRSLHRDGVAFGFEMCRDVTPWFFGVVKQDVHGVSPWR